MATIFQRLSTTLKESTAEITKVADSLQQKSGKSGGMIIVVPPFLWYKYYLDSLDRSLQDIRVQNREELAETDNRIRGLQREIEDLKRPTVRDYSLMATKQLPT